MEGVMDHDDMPGGIGYWVRRRAELFPKDLALIDPDRSLTWQEFNRRVNQLVEALTEQGVGFGERIAALLWNSTPFLEAVFATAKMGAILVPINFRLAAPEIRYILDDSGSRLMLAHESFRRTAELVKDPEHLIFAADPEQTQDNAYEALLASYPGKEPPSTVHARDIHLMMYTSGTTGRPKGARLSHRNANWNAIQLMLHEASLHNHDVVLTVAPLFHIGGLGVHTLPALYQGVTVVLLPHFDPVDVLNTIQQRKVTALFMVPAMWQALSQVPDFENYDLSSLRSLVSGGAPCPIPLIEFYQSRGFTFLEGFGMTETAPNTMILNAQDAVRKHGSIGRPLFYQEARIVNNQDQDVARDTVGELVLKGPNIFEGYWKMPEATQEAFRQGWFHTGDLAYMDEEGFFFLVDRKKDMLISGGENVYPIEVEQVLVRHPNILEAAVIGVPDSKWGAVPYALVVLKDPAHPVSIEDLTHFCRDKLAAFKIPRYMSIVEELPRNATGKVLKTVLREHYHQESHKTPETHKKEEGESNG